MSMVFLNLNIFPVWLELGTKFSIFQYYIIDVHTRSMMVPSPFGPGSARPSVGPSVAILHDMRADVMIVYDKTFVRADVHSTEVCVSMTWWKCRSRRRTLCIPAAHC